MGRLLWQQPYSQGYDEHSACPLYDEPFLRTMQPFRAGSDLFVIEDAPGKAADAEDSAYRLRRVRHDAKMSNDVVSSVLLDGYVYGFDLAAIQTSRHRPSQGQFRCMNFKTGEILWSSDRPGQASIVAADGKLLLFNDRGELLLVRANPRRCESSRTPWSSAEKPAGRRPAFTAVGSIFAARPGRRAFLWASPNR